MSCLSRNCWEICCTTRFPPKWHQAMVCHFGRSLGNSQAHMLLPPAYNNSKKIKFSCFCGTLQFVILHCNVTKPSFQTRIKIMVYYKSVSVKFSSCVDFPCCSCNNKSMVCCTSYLSNLWGSWFIIWVNTLANT